MATKLNSTLLREIQSAERSSTFANVSLFQIRLDPNQPRKLQFGSLVDNPDGVPMPPAVRLTEVQRFLSGAAEENQAALVRLAVNILQDGVRTPITATVDAGGLYRVVTGERRVTAALMARNWADDVRNKKPGAETYTLRAGYDYDTIPAVVEPVENAERFRVQVAENLLRQDMSAEDLGRAWKKMLDDSLFPNVYSIARHFGLEETRVQSHLDMVNMSDVVVDLRSRGIQGLETVGRLLSDLRTAEKRGEPAALYDRYLEIWDARTGQDDAGNLIYPSARSVMDAARQSLKVSPVVAPVAQSNQAPTAPAPQPAVPKVARDPVADTLDVGDTGELSTGSSVGDFADELEADTGDVDDLPDARVGENIPRAPTASALDRPHKDAPLIIPSFQMSRDQARRLLKNNFGINLTDTELTANAVLNAISAA